MPDQFARTRLLIGDEGVEVLRQSRVCVFGLGGVGGYVVEALVRAGVGSLDIVDNDTIDPTNLNRQVIATWDTVGLSKVDAWADRIRAINPECRVTKHDCFYLPETRGQFDFAAYDYVVDAVDTVTAKLDLAVAAHAAGTPLISCMGTGNKLDPTRLKIADIYDTSVCRLARIMRKELRKRGVGSLKCVYSTEEAVATPQAPGEGDSAMPAESLSAGTVPAEGATISNADGHTRENEGEAATRQRPTPGSVSFVPSVAGLLIASEVVKDLLAR